MPEGHTLHRLALDQGRALIGHAVAVSSPQGRFDEAALVDGKRVVAVEALGKHLFYRFAGGRCLHVHLGLFGRYFRHTPPPPPPRATVRLRLATDEVVFDLVGPTACELLTLAELRALEARLGPDPIREDADPERAWSRIAKSPTPIGALLLDQSVISGVGNVYRAEALFVHRLHPERPARTLDRATFDALWATLVRLLRKGVRDGKIATVPHRDGTRQARGERLYIYKRRACPDCGESVRRWELRGRWAYACEQCQPPHEQESSP